jgi:hypothetical protein
VTPVRHRASTGSKPEACRVSWSSSRGSDVNLHDRTPDRSTLRMDEAFRAPLETDLLGRSSQLVSSDEVSGNKLSLRGECQRTAGQLRGQKVFSKTIVWAALLLMPLSACAVGAPRVAGVPAGPAPAPAAVSESDRIPLSPGRPSTEAGLDSLRPDGSASGAAAVPENLGGRRNGVPKNLVGGGKDLGQGKNPGPVAPEILNQAPAELPPSNSATCTNSLGQETPCLQQTIRPASPDEPPRDNASREPSSSQQPVSKLGTPTSAARRPGPGVIARQPALGTKVDQPGPGTKACLPGQGAIASRPGPGMKACIPAQGASQTSGSARSSGR